MWSDRFTVDHKTAGHIRVAIPSTLNRDIPQDVSKLNLGETAIYVVVLYFCSKTNPF